MVIKEARGRICVLREDNYSARLDKFVKLFYTARLDFLTLKMEDVTIVHFGGERHKGMWGIEFTAPEGAIIPSIYQEIRDLEHLL